MTGGWAVELMLGGIVMVGASVQFLTGMGFALVAVPALVLVLGPGDGVSLSNCASGAISLIGLAGGWRRVRLTAMIPLICASVCTVPVGAWVASRLPGPVLLSCMGALVTVLVLFVMRGGRTEALRGVRGALTAGAAGGFMNSSAGVGGPPVSMYAVNAGWTVREFVPNAQFYGITVNAVSIASKGLPQVGGTVWELSAVGLAVGAVIGKLLAERVPEKGARRLVLLLALTGGVTTLTKGLSGL
ncbi:MAG: sulfite exporter TauE/SafE family protein [Actinomycetia bacterium]|nr:sulfite exporter TauE/SafE family protein [Actinomycetes bacterium]